MMRSYNTTDVRNDCLEVTRRLYRGAAEVAKRLDEQKSSALSTADIFTPEGEVLRAKLKDYCERLIFKDSNGQTRKIEELLWRRGFYDAVSAAKKLRKNNVWNEMEKALLSTHLAVGVGFYHHLILRLQLEYSLDLDCIVDFAYPQNKSGNLSKESITPVKAKSEETRQCAIRIVHRSLICLGDLARYKVDLHPNWDPMIATRYYKMAIAMEPNIGMPYNQLGTMAGNKNYGIDAVYYYLRCILCAEPFEGVEGNLKRIVATNMFYRKEDSPSRRCIARLFTLLKKWDTNSSNINQINEDSQNLLIDIENCLNMKSKKSTGFYLLEREDTIDQYLQNCTNELVSYLTDEIVFKIMSICLMSISKMKLKNSLHLNGAIAFILSVLSTMIQIATVRLQQSIVDTSHNINGTNYTFIDKDDLKIIQQTSEDIHVDNNENYKSKDVVKNGNSKKFRGKSKNLLSKLRRPRKRFNSSDSDISDFDEPHINSSSDEFNSDISETEQDDILSEANDELSEKGTDDESQKIENFHDENEEKKIDNEVHDTIEVNGHQIEENNTLEYNAELKKQKLEPKEHLEILSKEGLFQSIKIGFDWLRGNPEILKLASNCSQTLLNRIFIFLNLINIDTETFLKNSDKESAFMCNHEKLIKCMKVIPLPEDADLKGFNLLKNAHENLDWTILRKLNMNLDDETLLRSLKLVDFGHYLCTIQECHAKFDDEKRLFVMLEPTELEQVKEETEITDQLVKNEEESEEKNEEAKVNAADHSKGKLMRHMGKLWLKAEVRALESQLKSKLMSPYLVPDHEALAKHTPLLKQLVYAKKFIVIIPSIVVSALDEMKRTSGRAREATRWLETQLTKGSRFLRAQRPQERLSLPYIKGPRPKDKEAWLFFQIIECCHYLTQQTKVGISGDAEPPVVTLLTGISVEERKSSTFSSDGLAQSAGVNLEHIESFHTKWKMTCKNHG